MKVRFRFPDGTSAETEGYDQLNLLAHVQLVERSAQSRCGGQCECGTCRVTIMKGRVSPMRGPERELLKLVGERALDVRLACQTFPEPDAPGGGGVENIVEIDVPDTRFVDARKMRPPESK